MLCLSARFSHASPFIRNIRFQVFESPSSDFTARPLLPSAPRMTKSASKAAASPAVGRSSSKTSPAPRAAGNMASSAAAPKARFLVTINGNQGLNAPTGNGSMAMILPVQHQGTSTSSQSRKPAMARKSTVSKEYQKPNLKNVII